MPTHSGQRVRGAWARACMACESASPPGTSSRDAGEPATDEGEDGSPSCGLPGVDEGDEKIRFKREPEGT
ncbi:hypothetical protein HHA02_34000 [Cobetia marina]|nr:hypothetical protein HHA02_34000 [Cobetia marina]